MDVAVDEARALEEEEGELKKVMNNNKEEVGEMSKLESSFIDQCNHQASYLWRSMRMRTTMRASMTRWR